MQRTQRERGFTLIELMVVLTILAMLAALVVPRLFKNVDKAKANAAKTQIAELEQILDHYRLDVGSYPTTQIGLEALRTKPTGVDKWDGPYVTKEIPLDPWGRAYLYKSPGDHGDYDLMSYGADGLPGGEGVNADIVSWK